MNEMVIRLMLATMAIIMSCSVVEAKLTIGYIPYGGDGVRTEAQLRQGLVELYGEEWVRKYALENIGHSDYVRAFIGKEYKMILIQHVSSSGDLIFKIKEVLDYMAMKGDTIYVTGPNPYEPLHYDDLTYIMMRNRFHIMLLVGDMLTISKMVNMPIGFFFLKPEQVYGHESELDDILKLKPKGVKVSKKKEKEYRNRLFDLIMKSDRELLGMPIECITNKKPIIQTDYSYEYDPDGEVTVLYETTYRGNESPSTERKPTFNH